MPEDIVGQIALELGINTDDLARQLKQAGKKASKEAESSFSGVGKKIAAGLSIAAITKFTSGCIELGSNIAEVQNVVDTAFGNLSGSANNFASTAIEKFGLSELAAKNYMGVLGQMSTSMGFTKSQALDMAQAVTGLSGDVASFYNLDSDEAFNKLKAIWTGETEGLKSLGVMLTQTNLDQYALNNGFGKTTAKMTEQEKVMLRYQYTLSALSNASGDFVKTQDGWANQVRVLTLRFDSLKATLGQGFINLFSPIVKGINTVMAGLQSMAQAFTDFTAVLMGVDAEESLSGVSSSAIETASNIAGIGDATSAAAEQVEKALAGFDQITKLSDTTANQQENASAVNVDLTPITNEASSATKAVSPLAETLKEAFKPLKDISFKNVINSLKGLKDALKPIGATLISGISSLWSDCLVPMAKFTIEDVIPAFIDMLSGALSILNGVIDTIKPVWSWMWENLFKPLRDWTNDFIVKVIKDLAEVLKAVGDNETAVKVVTGLLAALIAFNASKSIKGTIASISTIGKKISELGKIGKVGLTIGVAVTGFEIGNWLYTLFTGDKTEYDLNDYIGVNFNSDEWIEALSMAWNDLCSWVDTNIFKPVGDFAVSLFNAITAPFVSIADFFGGVFATAWQRVKDVFSAGGKIFDGIKDGILSGLKAVVNALITGINKVIAIPFNGINAALQAIKDVNIFGLKPFDWISTIPVPQIPKLAQGGYVKANTPQLVMVGDNMHQGEVIAPEDKLLGMARQAADMSNDSRLLMEAISILKEILKILQNLDLNIYIDGRNLKDYLVEKINEHTMATGKCEIIM
ncbi:MAG: hypothetical protein ACI4EV_02145 [Lachnospiraceae bacterium]